MHPVNTSNPDISWTVICLRTPVRDLRNQAWQPLPSPKNGFFSLHRYQPTLVHLLNKDWHIDKQEQNSSMAEHVLCMGQISGSIPHILGEEWERLLPEIWEGWCQSKVENSMDGIHRFLSWDYTILLPLGLSC